jgi:hypothetical protein
MCDLLTGKTKKRGFSLPCQAIRRKAALMAGNVANRKIILFSIALISIALNLYTFSVAYPQTFIINSGISAGPPLAKDFSAYYTAAWRLFHDPSNVYTKGLLADGGPQILPHPEPYKYLPIFLIFIAPLTLLNYQSALTAFDVIQFLLLPVMALLIYKILSADKKSLLIIAVVLVLSLLMPSPTPNWGLSVGYFWQWAEGQDKVLNTVILLLSFYLGQTKKPFLSGIALALGSFDPRFFILAMPLFILYNKLQLKKAVSALIVSLGIFNLPLLIGSMGTGFISMVFNSGLETPLYYYGLIPLITIGAIMVANWRELYDLARSYSKELRLRVAGFEQRGIFLTLKTCEDKLQQLERRILSDLI